MLKPKRCVAPRRAACAVQEAKQEKVVEFMTKVKQAALRYLVTK